jgi:hypothetical protein
MLQSESRRRSQNIESKIDQKWLYKNSVLQQFAEIGDNKPLPSFVCTRTKPDKKDTQPGR